MGWDMVKVVEVDAIEYEFLVKLHDHVGKVLDLHEEHMEDDKSMYP